MKILMVHNRYQYRGGEDAVFEAEAELLQNHGQTVETRCFNNDHIQGLSQSIQAGLGSLYNPRSANQLKQAIRAFQPDLIHIHNFFPVGSPALMLTARHFGIPVVMTLHNYRLICPSALLLRDSQPCELCISSPLALHSIRYGCYRGSRVASASVAAMNTLHHWAGTWKNAVQRYITLTQFSRQKILGAYLGLRPEQVVTKPNFLADPGVAGEKENTVVFIGRLSVEKGIQVLLQTFAEQKTPLIILGEGPLESQVRAFAEAHPHVQFLGFQEKPQVLATLKKARALVFPSLWYEGFPMTLLEALACGTPVVTSNLGGAAEIITHGVNGLHFQAGDARSLGDTLKLLWADEAGYQNLVYNARKTYETHYTPEQNYTQLMEIYHHVLNPGATAEASPVT